MKMNAMKKPVEERPPRRVILPAPQVAIKSAPSGSNMIHRARRPENILPAPGFSSRPGQQIKSRRPSEPSIRSSQREVRVSRSRDGSQRRNKGSGRLKTISSRIKVKRDVVSKRFLRFSIPRVNFQRVVREIASETFPGCKFRSEALFALQAACEEFLVGFFHDANLCTLHASRKTLMTKDIDLVKRLRGMDTAPTLHFHHSFTISTS